jgi:two-component system, NtrC family, sensor kinase
VTAPRALIVDDSLTVRMDIGEALQSAGFDTVLCSDLRTARAALARGDCDVVILDVLLPDGDGLGFLKELRAAPVTSALPVLLLSTEAEVKSRVAGMGAGASEYLGKPYDLAQVVARARCLVQLRASTRTPSQKRVLIIDDSATFRNELRGALEGEGFEVDEVPTGEEGLTRAAVLRPDAIVVDGMLPGIDGATVVRRLKCDSGLRSTPCLLLTAAEGADDELKGLEAGADAYVRKSEDLRLILMRLAALMRGATAGGTEAGATLLGPKRLLAVDDSMTYLQELGNQLRQEGYDVVLAKSGLEALELLAVQAVDCILLDLIMPGLSGQDTCKRIKQSPQWRDIPLVMLTARDGRDAMIEGMNAGADDYIAKSADFDVLKARLRAQLRRKHFEDENRRIREQLVRRETEARFQRLIHSNIIGVILGDLGGRIIDANDAFLAMLGYSRPELAAGMLKLEELTPSEWRERDETAIAQLKKTGSATPFEKELLRKDGSRLSIVLGLVLLEGADKTVGFVLDRTEQKEAEQKIKRYAAALEGANHELESFSYSVAHDLRAPLRSIDGFSQALLEDYNDKLDDGGKKYLRFIRESAQHMAQLIDDLLTLSRVTRSELHREPVDLSALALATITRLQRANPDRKVEIVIQERLAREGDPRLLAVVFDNLLGNAWKFTSKREAGRIEFGATSNGGPPAFFVRDNGAGFDMAFASKLFGVFQRLHAATEFEGTGVGLATVQRIVHRHGGRVRAEGEVNRGATFYFTLEEDDTKERPK